jgi:hypothetical protein
MIERSVFAWRVAVVAGLAGILVAAGCGSSSSPPVFGSSGAVPGVPDMHCTGVAPIVVQADSCHPPATDAGSGEPDVDGGATPEFGDTIYNSSGADDDCKYSLSFTDSPAVKVNEPMTFKLVLKKLADGSPASGAVDGHGNGVDIQGFMASSATHTLPNTTPSMSAIETPANSGVYTISPVEFDAPGHWVIRFHLFEQCSDSVEDSPHGHGAFFFDVP